MLEKDFDQLIRQQFEDHSSSVPVDMWQRIKGKEDKDRKGLFFWKWYFLGPAFLALFLIGGQLFFRHTIHIRPASTPARSAAAAPPVTPALAKTPPPAGSNAPASAPAPASAQTATPTATLAAPSVPPVATPDAPLTASTAGPATPASATTTTAPPIPPLASTESAPHQPSDRPSPPPTSPATTGTLRPQSLSCPDPSKKFTKSKGWYLEALGSPDYPIVHGSLNGSSISELPLLSYTIGIRATKIFESGFLMTAGLQYSWVNLRNRYDSLPLPNHFRNLDIPLLIGYEKGNDLFKASIRGGMILNIHSWPVGSDQYFSNYLKSNTGISSYIGIELIRQVNDRISIYVEPYYRHQFSNMFKNPFDEKIDVTGIFLGLRFALKSPGQ